MSVFNFSVHVFTRLSLCPVCLSTNVSVSIDLLTLLSVCSSLPLDLLKKAKTLTKRSSLPISHVTFFFSLFITPKNDMKKQWHCGLFPARKNFPLGGERNSRKSPLYKHEVNGWS